MGLPTHNPTPDESKETAGKQPAHEKPARGMPGSFDQPESRPEVMPREGGPHPEQTAEVPLGHHGRAEPPGSFGHNSAPVKQK